MTTRNVCLMAMVCAACASDAYAQRTPRTLALVQDLKIDGAREDISARGSLLWLARDGRSAIFDVASVRFVFFDANGKRIGTFGSRGHGPGEFASMADDRMGSRAAEIVPALRNEFNMQTGSIGDTMWVHDRTQRRFTLIAPDLKLIRTMPEPTGVQAGLLSFTEYAMLPGGRVLGRALWGRQADRTFTWSDSAIVVLKADGTLERRVGELPRDNSVVTVTTPRTASAPVPFAHRAYVAPAPSGDRIVIASTSVTSATGGTLTLIALRPAGDTIYSRAHPYTAPAVTARMADSAYKRLEQRHNDDGELLKLVRERIPAVQRPFASFDVGVDGSVWATRAGPASEPREVLLFGPAGDLAGAVTLPRPGMRVAGGTMQALWATEADSDGFVSVVRFRVEGGR